MRRSRRAVSVTDRGHSLKRLIALIVAAVGLTTMLTSCEVTQIDWRNHFYVVSRQSCLDDGSLTVRNGTGKASGPDGPIPLRVDVVKTVYGDLTHDGIQDVAVLLRCTELLNPEDVLTPGYEIQVFTRNGQPVARISAPQGVTWPAHFVPSEMLLSPTDVWDKPQPALTTGVLSYDQNDPLCCPSLHEKLYWTWDGRHDFRGIGQTINGP
jgi:hypothetical protein